MNRQNRLHVARAVIALTASLGSVTAMAQADHDFPACVAALKVSAIDAGIDAAVVNTVMDNVQRLERVVELDRQQPEFTRTFANYYNARVTEGRVQKGRELLREHRTLLKKVERDYGIPAQYLVAFWGLETNFGSYFGNMPVPNALTTLACDQRRSSFFTAELLEALKIIESGDIEAEKMVGSWAGAMGNFQFLPSVYRQHAVDADGDRRKDVWNSLPDALTSAGRFLQHLGWETGYRWGREVRLPEGFDYSLTGRDQPRPLSYWAEAGVTNAYGGAMPKLDLPSAILVPSGEDGPAFLTYPNFDIIMRWNRSEYYALAVGRLADRIAGSGELTRAPADAELKLTFDDVRSLQASLQALGYSKDEPDGLFGPKTRRALSAFQRDRGQVADGHPDEEALQAVRAASEGAASGK